MVATINDEPYELSKEEYDQAVEAWADMIIAQQMLDGSVLHVPGIVPKLSRTPGRISRQAPEVGQDNREILQEIGLTDEQITALEARGIIWSQA